MKNLTILSLAVLIAAPAHAGSIGGSAASWMQGISEMAPDGFSGFEAPAIEEAAEVPAELDYFALVDEAKSVDGRAAELASDIAGLDAQLDAAYDKYRESLRGGDLKKIEELKADRSYYASIWETIVGPSAEFKAGDPRITPILQALFVYLRPLPPRLDAAKQGLEDAAKKVERSRDRARASLARLETEDSQMVREMALAGKSLARVEEKIPEMRRESKEYMGWVRQAYNKSAAWAEAAQVHETYTEQHAAIDADFRVHNALAQELVRKKLGPARMT